MTAARPVLRLIADDLTGALDTAAELVPAVGPVTVALDGGDLPAGGALAVDAATREETVDVAAARTAAIAARIGLADAALAYLKLDSLLRGHAAAEIAALAAGFDAVVIAPAFPFQHRRTVGGRQQALVDGAWRPVGEDLAAALAARGVAVRLAGPDGAIAAGVTLVDAESDDDLRRLAAAGLAYPGRLLWCGAGGLAAALAPADVPMPRPALAGPILGLIGTDHPVTRSQLAAVGTRALRLPEDPDAAAAAVTARLGRGDAVFATLDLPALPRDAAKARIAAGLGAIARALPPPTTFVCGGGETLRALCRALGAERLRVVGRLEPGVPVSRLEGGAWSGCLTVSKSGAFGAPDFLLRLAEAASPTKEPVT